VLVLLVALAALPWAFGALLPQVGEVGVGLAALSAYSPFLLAVLLVVAALRRARVAVLLGAALLVASVVVLLPAYVGDPVPRGPVLRVMTVNLMLGRADASRVVELVRRHRIDVLAMEELTPAEVARLGAAGLESELPYSVVHAAAGAEGTGLWSRLPLWEVAARPTLYRSAAAELVVEGRTVRVRALHPPPPVDPALWRRDYRVLRQQAADDRGVATLLLGDFNASVHHRELQRLMGSRWRDAAEVVGAGLVRTWSPARGVLPPLLDPDHVLVDRGMGVARWSSADVRGSDHDAVLVDVVLRPRSI
jgi:endonuclease/exonuclease/phosphatase (EEP) superfamily protein YafD